MIRKRTTALLLLPACTACSVSNQRVARDSQTIPLSDSATYAVLLGTGTPNAEPDRSGPAVAIVVNGSAYLVDCGPGVVRRAKAAYQAGVKALVPSNLSHVFITHLHSDHTLGYPDLIFTPWTLERTVPLEAYGPIGLADMTDSILDAYKEDVRVRLDGLEPANDSGHDVNVHEITAGVIYEDTNVRVTAFPVRHGAWRRAFGYRFETADRTIVVSGDTAPCASLVLHAKDADLLIHEVYSKVGFDRRAPVWQRYHAGSHTSTIELAEIARQTNPKLLVLTHLLLWRSSPEELVSEIKVLYDGEVRCGRDLKTY